MKTTLPPLPEEELAIAAMFFTLSNMGQGEPRTARGIRDAFATLQMGCESEGIDLGPEHRDWVKNMRSGDAYWRDEWEKEKATITGLPTSKVVVDHVPARWDVMTPGQRADVIKSDASMRLPRWASLVASVSAAPFAGLSGIQQDMVRQLLGRAL